MGQHSAGFQDTQNISTTKHTHRERERIANYLTRALVWWLDFHIVAKLAILSHINLPALWTIQSLHVVGWCYDTHWQGICVNRAGGGAHMGAIARGVSAGHTRLVGMLKQVQVTMCVCVRECVCTCVLCTCVCMCKCTHAPVIWMQISSPGSFE